MANLSDKEQNCPIEHLNVANQWLIETHLRFGHKIDQTKLCTKQFFGPFFCSPWTSVAFAPDEVYPSNYILGIHVSYFIFESAMIVRTIVNSTLINRSASPFRTAIGADSATTKRRRERTSHRTLFCKGRRETYKIDQRRQDTSRIHR